MAGFSTMVARNIRLYFSDKASVFFSLLGALIAIFLILFFLKSTLVSSITSGFAGLVTDKQSERLLDCWLVASACVIASGTTGLGALGQFVSDRESHKWRDFLVAPVPRWWITGAYLLAAAIVSMIMTTIVYVVGTAYCFFQSVPLGATDLVIAWGWLMLSSVGFTCLMGFAVSFLRTMGAFSGLSIVVGVLFGFFSETYVTTDELPDSVATFLASLPFAQASALVREPYTSAMIASLPEVVRQPTTESMGITLTIGTYPVTAPLVAAVLIGMAVVFSVLAWQIMARSVQR